MTDLEEKLRTWAQPPSEAQEKRCKNAEEMIRKAIQASDALKRRNILIFMQGSYANNTNTARTSDVDVGVVCQDIAFNDLPEGKTLEDFGLVPASYTYETFKNEVGEALVSYFRGGTVTPGNKAFDIKANSYHVEADVAAFFVHNRYSASGSVTEGRELRPDNGGRVKNWPDQHKSNGIEKNNATGRRFKRMVRVVKSANDLTANPAPGFLLECLMWNVPNFCYEHATYEETLRVCLGNLHHNLSTAAADEWGEVSELKYLFRGNPWTKADATTAVLNIWNQVGL